MSTTDRTDYADASTRWTCSRKKAYTNEKLAKHVAREMTETNAGPNARPGFEGLVVVAYACTRCGQYHTGRAPA